MEFNHISALFGELFFGHYLNSARVFKMRKILSIRAIIIGSPRIMAKRIPVNPEPVVA